MSQKIVLLSQSCCSACKRVGPGSLNAVVAARGRTHGHVYLPQRCASAPPAQALVEVEHGDVGEVWHARDHLQEPEALHGALVVDDVQHVAQPARAARRELRKQAAAAMPSYWILI